MHIDCDTREAVLALADLAGVTTSEYVCDLITRNLKSKLDDLSVLQKWEISQGTVRTVGSDE